MRAEAAISAGTECCGLLLGRDMIEDIQPATNVAAQPERHFEIDPQTLIDAHRAARLGGPAVLGYYHSHPLGPAVPSAVDREMSAGDGLVWAILAENDTTFWRDDSQGFARLSYVVEDR